MTVIVWPISCDFSASNISESNKGNYNRSCITSVMMSIWGNRKLSSSTLPVRKLKIACRFAEMRMKLLQSSLFGGGDRNLQTVQLG